MKFFRILTAVIAAVILLASAGCNKKEAARGGNVADVTLGPGDVYAIFNIMNYGEVDVKLYPELAPVAVEKFTERAERGYYNYKTFHRVLSDALIQGGSFLGDGNDGDVPAAEYFAVETSKHLYCFNGALVMAAVPEKGNYSQFFFVNTGTSFDVDAEAERLQAKLDDSSLAPRIPPDVKASVTAYIKKLKGYNAEVKEKYAKVGGIPEYDGAYTVFGQVVDGMDVLAKISAAEVMLGNTADDTSGKNSRPVSDIVMQSVEIVKMPLPETSAATSETEETKKAKKKKKTVATTAAAPQEELSEPAESEESTESSETETSVTETSEPTSAETSESAGTETSEPASAEETLTDAETVPVPQNTSETSENDYGIKSDEVME